MCLLCTPHYFDFCLLLYSSISENLWYKGIAQYIFDDWLTKCIKLWLLIWSEYLKRCFKYSLEVQAHLPENYLVKVESILGSMPSFLSLQKGNMGKVTISKMFSGWHTKEAMY